MNNKDPFLKFMDHSALKIDATEEIIRQYAQEVVDYNLHGTCFRPNHVKIASEILGNKYHNSAVLVFPTKKSITIEEMINDRKNTYMSDGLSLADARKNLIDIALNNGADQLDPIIDLEAAYEGNYNQVRADIEGIRKYVGDSTTLKVIECAPYFNNKQLADITKAVVDGGADYVKTTTGFGFRAASLRDIFIFGTVLQEISADNIGIKVAGGIKAFAEAAAAYGLSQAFGSRPFIIGESSYGLNQNPLAVDTEKKTY